MPRFFVDAALEAGTSFELPEPVLRHVQVLRLKEGDALTLFNGRGGEVPATLLALEKRRAVVSLAQALPLERESRLEVGLVQAVSSGEKMDFTLQKGVELGVAWFQPVLSERSVVRLSGERADKRVARWQDIVVSACEQSGRNRIPEVRPLLGYDEWLRGAQPDGARLMLSPLGKARLSALADSPRRASLLAGPEGGLSAREEAAALAAGWTPLKLGERILRTETAALAAVAALQTLWGDFA
ncbi:16S rRNA (uracil(1498)-N(3))-methyltransferase [Crenobacter luteus]|uniref:Ribosomal RNA small subunit methyltransferase E n=1 Tax=Crenobacter luteus TaxID=1452487 RepID=A0A161S9U4_9NEIS|nr:16S rRNA (uracil(1498)-N(3))-methyltransferase [Crenobacter luteus]KZE32453.1 16S rRNA methyltransferase [Crenobacter luteus]